MHKASLSVHIYQEHIINRHTMDAPLSLETQRWSVEYERATLVAVHNLDQILTADLGRRNPNLVRSHHGMVQGAPRTAGGAPHAKIKQE